MVNTFKSGRPRIKSGKTRKPPQTQSIPPKPTRIGWIFIPAQPTLPTWEEMRKMAKDLSHDQ